MTTPFDMLTAMDARQQAFQERWQAEIEREREQERLRTLKFIRLPIVTGTMVTGATIGGDTQSAQAPATPEQGYVWHVRHLVIEGLASGATPDIVNILRQGRIVWQLNGNQFAQTWGRGEMRLVGGELLSYAAVGTIASKTITIRGTAEEVAAEQEGKFR